MERSTPIIRETLLTRLDRVSVHQSVAARYCKESAALVREMRNALEQAAEAQELVGAARASANDKLFGPNGIVHAALAKAMD